MRRATGRQQDRRPDAGISIHALHEESDETAQEATRITSEFQSTLSMRRATFDVWGIAICPRSISIHALHEESDPQGRDAAGPVRPISIHALHEESDSGPQQRIRQQCYFNPRSP